MEENLTKELKDAKVLALLNQAEQARSRGDKGQEAEALALALQYSPKDPLIWSKLGQAYRRAGLLDKARECHNQALAIDPEYGWAYANLGAVYIAKGDYHQACQYYAQALARLENTPGGPPQNQDFAIVLGNYALALGKNGDRKQAARLLKRAAKLGYQNAEVVSRQLKLSLWDKLFS